MQIIAYIIPLIAGCVFLYLAIRVLWKENYKVGGLLACFAAFFLLCSLPWFQGLAKTLILSTVSEQLTALGKKIDDVHKTTAEMHAQLESHQNRIDQHQRDLDAVQTNIVQTLFRVSDSQANITNQFHKLLAIGAELESAQTNIDAQRKQIADVEYWVQNLFSKMTNETFTISDEQRMLVIPSTNRTLCALLKLYHPPLPGSLKLTAVDKESRFPQQLENLATEQPQNFAILALYGFDSNTLSVAVSYVIDSRQTNLTTKLPKVRSIQTLPSGKMQVVSDWQ
jgi:septal ring factor EnvC (AmiA/AmiB activator)